MDVSEYTPTRDQYAYTFGGVASVMRIRPGTALRLWSEDAFNGVLRSVDDLSSAKVDLRFVNPQTGPFYVEGAEPGDTLVLHLAAVEPARDWGASAAIPFFGGMTSTDRVVTLQEPLPDTTWIYELDRDRGTVGFAARHSDHRIELPIEPMLGTVGVAPVAISSVSGRESDFASGPYGTAKTAIVGYIHGLAFQLAEKNIRANTVSPGNTYFEGGVWHSIETGNPTLFETAVGLNPTGQMGTPEHVAAPVVFLASPVASRVSGTNLIVDGALTRGVQL